MLIFLTKQKMAEIKTLTKDREKRLSEYETLNHELLWMENQLAALPFYAEYIEKRDLVNKMKKEIVRMDGDIFDTIIESWEELYRWDKFVYKIKTSSAPSVTVTDEEVLPEEAFKKAVIGKRDLGKLIQEYADKGETFPWATVEYKKSLEVI